MAARGDRPDEFAVQLTEFIAMYRRLEALALAEQDDRKAFGKANELLKVIAGMRRWTGRLRARIVARAWNGSRLTYAQVGEKLGVSRQRVNQLMQADRGAEDGQAPSA